MSPRRRRLRCLPFAVLFLVSCQAHEHRTVSGSGSPQPTGPDLISVELADSPEFAAPRASWDGDNPTLVSLRGREIRASEIGSWFFKTHRQEALASLSKLVGLSIAEQEGDRLGIECPESELRAHREERKKDVEQQAVITYGVGTSPDVLTRARFGMSAASWLDQQAEREKERYLLSRLIRFHEISNDHLELALIVVGTEDQARDVDQRLRDGAEFGPLAHKYSEDPSASQGGRLPPMSRSALPRSVQTELQELKVGERTGILSLVDAFGRRRFQIFKVLNAEAGRAVSYDQVAGEIEAGLQEKPVSAEEWASWYRAMERTYNVQLAPGL